jgi:hypothetical protein
MEGFKLTNKTDGGEGASGLVCAPEVRAKISAELRKTSLERSAQRKAYAQTPGGKVQLALAVEAMRQFRLGREMPPEWRESISVAHKENGVGIGTKHALGCVHTEEANAKQSVKQKAYSQTPKGMVQLAKALEAARLVNLGKKLLPYSAERRANISAGLKESFARKKREAREQSNLIAVIPSGDIS